MYVDADTIIKLAAFLGALATILTGLYKGFRFLERQKEQDAEIRELKEKHTEDIENIQKEQCVMCYTLLAVLDGLMQQGANGEVTKAHEKLQKHLNKTAHHWEEG